MSGFPKLIPALTTHIVLDPGLPVGLTSEGAPLTVAPFIAPNSYLRSVDDYPIKVDAVFVHGSDFIRQDPDGKHLRLDVNSVLKDKSGAYIGYKYSGIITMTPEISNVLGGKPDAKTTEFGKVFTHVLFETGSDALRDLERKVFVGSGRFIIETGKPVVVEYKISQVGL